MAFAPSVTDQSANYFARYGERQHEQQQGGTTASASGRTPQTRAIEAQAKAADRDAAEEAKRLRQVLMGHGLPKGQVESMSVGELKGVLDTWAMKHARHLEAEKMKQLEEQQTFENEYKNRRLNHDKEEFRFRQDQVTAQGEQQRAKQQAETDALAREQRALQAAGMEGSLQSGEGTYQGPLQPPAVTPGVAAGRAYLSAGGMDAGQLRAMSDVFTPQKQLSEPRLMEVNGLKVIDLGNGNRHVVKEAEEEPRAYFTTQAEADKHLKETGRHSTHYVVPMGPGRYVIKAKPTPGQLSMRSLYYSSPYGSEGGSEPPTPTPTPTPAALTPAAFSGVPAR
jgi:hypothetical protein